MTKETLCIISSHLT